MILSIIIPVYNVEKYIKTTLTSIYNQKFDETDYEVIIINDGTPDNSMAVVRDFTHHPNLVIINQENQGLSGARNTGIQAASGDFIWFVDSDDSVTEDSLSFIKKLVTNVDAEIYSFDMLKIEEHNHAERIEPIILKQKYSATYAHITSVEKIWKKIQICPAQRFLFSKKFIKQNKLIFFPGIYHEDEEFCVRALVHANRIAIVNKSIYKYLIRSSGSITSDFKMKSVWSRLQIVKNFINEGSKEISVYKKNVFFDRVFENDFWMLSIDPKIHDEYPAFISEYRNILKKQMRLSFFKSLHYMSIGKIYKLIRYAI